MPIKFRCTHCRQLLGISRSKAGEVFDCPTCGRTLRVPQLDGRSDPVPRPALNLNDPSLVSALDELAMIGQAGAGDSDDELDAAKPAPAVAVVKTDAAPAPRPAPMPVELPLPAEPVVKPRAVPVPHGVADLASESPAPLLAGLTAPSATASTGITAGSARGVSRRRFWSLLAITAAAAFVGGVFMGTAANRRAADTAAGSTVDPGRPQVPAAERRAAPRAGPAISGRISYESPSGRRPDRGARILVLPATKPGHARLLAATFRDEEASPDFRLARASLEALGGKVALADVQGNFAVDLPEPGVYRILVLSHFQRREQSEPIDSTLQQQLASWFDRPDQLLGQLAFHSGEVRYNGTRTELWDHTFPAPL